MQPSRAAWSSALLALCAAAAMCASVQPAAAAAARAPRRARSVSTDRWLNLLSEYARSPGGVGVGDGGWFPRPVPVELQLGGEDGARGGASVPLLVVPVPVPVPIRSPSAPATECATGTASATSAATVEQTGRVAPATPPTPRPQPLPPPQPPQPPRSPLRTVPRLGPVDNSRHLIEMFRAQVPSDQYLPPVLLQPGLGEDIDVELIDDEQEPAPAESVRASRAAHFDVWGASEDAPPPRASSRTRRRCRRPARPRGLLDDILVAEQPAQTRTTRATPPPPRFERPLKVRARLTVPRADYTETYTVWWDPASGASRIDFHGGTSSAYRIVRLDGTVQSILVARARGPPGAGDARRCSVAPPRRLQLAERALPALPDLRRFSFAGYVEGSAERVERWSYTLEGRGGELGGARGEALTYRHELLASRAADNHTALPIRYSVSVDSSVLGPDSDGYVHVYTEAVPMAHDSAMLRLDLADACDFVARTERLEQVEPLREFTMLQRDPRYDAALDRYKNKYERSYADDSEEAVRKNLLIQSYRFTESGNRQGATFVLGITFLSDRLVAERSELLGAVPTPTGFGAQPFPHAADDMDALFNSLPHRFDWRERGAVTHVRNQALCRSCWAFAVVGAVEGALAIKTGRLVPLSEQSLVDCAHPYGTKGCNGAWPSNAFEYVHEMGLPALADYPPYRAEVQQCEAHRVPPVARITGYVNVTRDDLLAVKVSIRKHGPNVVIIDGKADSLAHYKKGYYYDGRCKRSSPNHAVLAVGWVMHRQNTYIILKNSWGTGWGEDGYVLMRGTGNTCGVLKRASYPVLRDADVHSVPADAPAVAYAPSAPAADL